MADDVRDLPGLKEQALQDLGPCVVCGKAHLDPAAAGAGTFYLLSISRAMFDRAALARRVGLEMQLGNSAIARAMGPDEDLAKVFAGPASAFVHEDCAHRVNSLLELMPDRRSNGGGN